MFKAEVKVRTGSWESTSVSQDLMRQACISVFAALLSESASDFLWQSIITNSE